MIQIQALYECHTTGHWARCGFAQWHPQGSLAKSHNFHSQAIFRGTFVARGTQPPISSLCSKPEQFN